MGTEVNFGLRIWDFGLKLSKYNVKDQSGLCKGLYQLAVRSPSTSLPATMLGTDRASRQHIDFLITQEMKKD
jgi:hypothetical protein